MNVVQIKLSKPSTSQYVGNIAFDTAFQLGTEVHVHTNDIKTIVFVKTSVGRFKIYNKVDKIADYVGPTKPYTKQQLINDCNRRANFVANNVSTQINLSNPISICTFNTEAPELLPFYNPLIILPPPPSTL